MFVLKPGGIMRLTTQPAAAGFTMGRFVFALSFLSVVATAVIGWKGLGFYRTEFPDVSALKNSFPKVTYLGKDRPPKVTLQKTRPPGWVNLADVSREALGAVIVSEDWAFYSHKGYDPNQIKEAIKEDWEEGTFARGASTITQQVVRNVFLDKDKNLWRKIKELILAIQAERSVGKRKILESYFNIAEWGEGVFGMRAAALFYFKKSPAELTAHEGAFLAMLLPSPKRYSQSYRRGKLTAYARSTVNDILDKMVQAHYIDEDRRDSEKSARFAFEKLDTVDPLAPPPEPEGEGTDQDAAATAATPPSDDAKPDGA